MALVQIVVVGGGGIGTDSGGWWRRWWCMMNIFGKPSKYSSCYGAFHDSPPPPSPQCCFSTRNADGIQCHCSAVCSLLLYGSIKYSKINLSQKS